MIAGFRILTRWPASTKVVASRSPYVPVASRHAWTREAPWRVTHASSSAQPAGEFAHTLRRRRPSGQSNVKLNFALAISIPSTASIIGSFAGHRARSALWMQARLRHGVAFDTVRPD